MAIGRKCGGAAAVGVRKKRAMERFLPSAAPSRRPVAVEELVARVKAEGLPVTGR